MSESGIQAGAFVRYNHLDDISSIGKVKQGGDSPLVEFWNGKVERKAATGLTPLPDADAEPVARLWDRPEELGAWAKEKPLKLVALALSIDGHTGGNLNSIKSKLDGRALLGGDWKNWWSQRAKSLNEFSALPEPKHFAKSPKGNIYRLLCDIEAVPDDLRPPVSLNDWKKWLSSEANLPTFGKNPSKALCDALAEWPADTIESALRRILWGAELLLHSPKPSASAALAWLDAVGSAVLRRNELNPDGRRELAEQSSDVLIRLARRIKVKEKRKESTLFLAGQLSEAPDRAYQLEQQREAQRAEYDNRLEQQLARERKNHADKREAQRAEYDNRLEQQLARERKNHADKQEAQRAEYEAELERWRQQVRERNAELESNREESRLEIRQDMLQAIGETLQTVAGRQGSVDELARNVEAGLILALRAGGADLLDTSPEGKVIAPGVIVRGGVHGDRVLLKAQVKHEGV